MSQGNFNKGDREKGMRERHRKGGKQEEEKENGK